MHKLEALLPNSIIVRGVGGRRRRAAWTRPTHCALVAGRA